MGAVTARGLGWALLIAVLGGAGGYALVGALEDEPKAIDAAPVVAVSPSFPTDPPVVIEPDPDYPELRRSLPLQRVRVGSDSFGVTVPVPKGWTRIDTDLVESKWAPPEAPLNTYLLRVKIISGLRLTIEQALEQRRAALESVVTEWDLENGGDDTFTATYVYDEHRRLAIERFLSLDGSDAAFVTIAVIGRVVDREGLNDLLARVTAGTTR